MLLKKTGYNYICECGNTPQHYVELDYDEEWEELFGKGYTTGRILLKDCPTLSNFPKVLDQTEHLVVVED